jgi:hypothetical protein
MAFLYMRNPKKVGPSDKFWCSMKMCALTGSAENGSLLYMTEL